MNDTYSYDKEEIKEILDYAIRKIEQNISTIKDQQIEIDRLKKELEEKEHGILKDWPARWVVSHRNIFGACLLFPQLQVTLPKRRLALFFLEKKSSELLFQRKTTQRSDSKHRVVEAKEEPAISNN